MCCVILAILGLFFAIVTVVIWASCVLAGQTDDETERWFREQRTERSKDQC